MHSANHDRLWTTLTLLVLAWLTLLLAGAFLIVSPGQTTRLGNGGVAQVAGQPQAAAANLPTDIVVTATEFKFSPASLQLPAGKKVSITLHNMGSVEHDITVDALGVKLLAGAGKTTSGEFTLDKPGTYDYYCSIHPKMTGQIVVA